MRSLVEWHMREIDNIRKEINGVFNRFCTFFELEVDSIEEEAHFDLFEGRDQLILKANLPGIEAEDLDITIHGNTLTIKWETGKNSSGGGQGHRLARSFKLPFPVDSDKVEAIYKNGILTIYMPKQRVKEIERFIISVR